MMLYFSESGVQNYYMLQLKREYDIRKMPVGTPRFTRLCPRHSVVVVVLLPHFQSQTIFPEGYCWQ